MLKGNVVVVREFLNEGSSKPVSMSEMAEFWKACSTEEKEQYATEARALTPEVVPEAAPAIPV